MFAQEQAARYQAAGSDRAPARSRTPSNTARACASRRRRSDPRRPRWRALERQVDALKAQRNSAEANLRPGGGAARPGRAQPVLHHRQRRPARADRQPHRRRRRSTRPSEPALTMFVPDDIWVARTSRRRSSTPCGRASRSRWDRRLSGADPPRPCRERPAGIGHRFLPAAGRERDGQLREDRPARAGQDRHGQHRRSDVTLGPGMSVVPTVRDQSRAVLLGTARGAPALAAQPAPRRQVRERGDATRAPPLRRARRARAPG